MAKLIEIGSSLGKKLRGFLSDKPIWASLVAYTAVTGLCFGLVYALMRLVLVRWWVTVVVIFAIGGIWGLVTHRAKTRGMPDQKQDEPVD